MRQPCCEPTDASYNDGPFSGITMPTRPVQVPTTICRRCGKDRRGHYSSHHTAYCQDCVNRAGTCGSCSGPTAAWNRSGMCSRCRHAGKDHRNSAP